MNLRALKKMIAEEYSAYTEQAEPTVDVDAGDVDAGGDDSEDTLRQIYDMLKAHFEGGEDEAEGDDMDMDMDMDADDVDGDVDADDDAADAGEALQERFKKLANIIKG
tara:strand:+ start:853 stop:1176 length:324 start_codon:yes stop_codon:yes gene_type:complete